MNDELNDDVVVVERKARRGNITGSILGQLADKYGIQAVVDLVNWHDEKHPGRSSDSRMIYIPTMNALTRD